MTRTILVALLLLSMSPTLGRAAVLTVGPGAGQFATIGAAVSNAGAGDTVAITAGTYTDQTATVNVPLTIQAVGGAVVLTATGQLDNDKGFLVANADLTVRGIIFRNATADAGSGNGSGIRYQAGNLVVVDSVFERNQNGILATPNTPGTGTLTVTNSIFTGNGVASGQFAGFEHAIYAGDVAQVTVTGSSFAGTLSGHDIKSRAANTVVENDVLDDGVSGTASYAIDLSNGGDATITGNTLNQGPATQNPIIIAYDGEGLTHPDNSVLIHGNLFNNTLTSTEAFGVANLNTTTTPTNVTVSCNAFNGVQNPVFGAIKSAGNVNGATLPACGVTAIPEPSTHALLACAIALLLAASLPRGSTR